MRIKSSKRGLTFSFAENETFRAGAKYRYFHWLLSVISRMLLMKKNW